MDFDRLKTNLDAVVRRIGQAAARAGRHASAVRLLPVTKSVDAGVIGMLAELGCHAVGENRVHGAERKRAELPDGVAIEMIGHLQRNKVRKALPLFTRFHAVDSVRLAEALDIQCEKLGLNPPPILLEANVSGEEAKWGFGPDELRESIDRLAALRHVKIEGLMTMAPYDEDPEQARPVFRALRLLRDELATRNLPGLDLRELSMGMTQDFEVAIEEGATIVRVGTALFV